MGDVLAGNYSDFKFVKTRSVVQIVIELPIERAQEVFDLLGAPLPGAEIPVAIARLNLSAPAPTAAIESLDEDIWENREIEKPTRQYTLAQQAGMLCNDRGFWKWIEWETRGQFAAEINAMTAADYVRSVCRINSRTELDVDHDAELRFRDMRADYNNWINDR